jgi:hypothetical protein
MTMKRQNDEIDHHINQTLQALRKEQQDNQQTLADLRSRVEALETTINTLSNLPTQEQMDQWVILLRSLAEQLRIYESLTSREAKRP